MKPSPCRSINRLIFVESSSLDVGRSRGVGGWASLEFAELFFVSSDGCGDGFRAVCRWAISLARPDKARASA